MKPLTQSMRQRCRYLQLRWLSDILGIEPVTRCTLKLQQAAEKPPTIGALNDPVRSIAEGMMGGSENRSSGLFSCIRLEDRIAADHPLRVIRPLFDEVLAALSGRLTGLYATVGRTSIPPERFLRATQLQAYFFGSLGAAIYGADRLHSLRIRKRIEQAFGWAKTIGGIPRVTAAFTFPDDHLQFRPIAQDHLGNRMMTKRSATMTRGLTETGPENRKIRLPIAGRHPIMTSIARYSASC